MLIGWEKIVEDITPTQNKRLRYFKHEMIKVDCNKVSFNQLIRKLDDNFPKYQIFSYKCEKPKFRFDFPNRFFKSDLNNANMFILKDKENILIEGFLYGSKKKFVLHVFIEPFDLDKIKILARVLSDFDIKLPTRIFYDKKHKKKYIFSFRIVSIILIILGVSIFLDLVYALNFIFILVGMLITLIVLLINLVITLTVKKKDFDKKIFNK